MTTTALTTPRPTPRRYRRVLGLVVVLSSMLLSSCTSESSDTSFSFENYSSAAFGEDRVPSLAECYRALRTQDSIDRPDARRLDPVDPVQLRDGRPVGDLDNLPPHFSSPDLTRCDNAVISPTVAVGDLNNDGFDDLVKAPNKVYLNRGDATFRLVELPVPETGELSLPGINPIPTYERLPSAPVIVDIDNDGVLEILLSYRGGITGSLLALYRQIPVADGTMLWELDGDFDIGVDFTDQIAPAVQALTALDYDNDGYSDIAIGFFGGHVVSFQNEKAGFSNKGLMLLRNDGGRRLVNVTDSAGISEAIDAGVGPNVYRGSFTRMESKRSWTHAISTADLDNDGYVDMVVAGDFGTGLILWNESGRRFVLEDGVDFLGHSLMGPALTDINGDGYLDIFVSQLHSDRATRWTCAGGRPCGDGTKLGNFWWVSDGPRSYTNHAASSGLLDGGWGWGAVFVDFDNDGRDELVQAAGLEQMLSPTFSGWEHRDDPLRVWSLTSKPDARHPGGLWTELADAAGLGGLARTDSVATGDFNRDGLVDLVIGSPSVSQPLLMLNRSRSVGRWLEVSPVQKIGARSVPVVGARIEVTYRLDDGSTRTAVRYSGTQSQSYYSNSAAVTRFGVGENSRVKVSVRFPDGGVSVVDEQATDRTVVVLR